MDFSQQTFFYRTETVDNWIRPWTCKLKFSVCLCFFAFTIYINLNFNLYLSLSLSLTDHVIYLSHSGKLNPSFKFVTRHSVHDLCKRDMWCCVYIPGSTACFEATFDAIYQRSFQTAGQQIFIILCICFQSPNLSSTIPFLLFYVCDCIQKHTPVWHL